MIYITGIHYMNQINNVDNHESILSSPMINFAAYKKIIFHLMII